MTLTGFFMVDRKEADHILNIRNVISKEGEVVINLVYEMWQRGKSADKSVLWGMIEREEVLDIDKASEYICSSFDQLSSDQKDVIINYIFDNLFDVDIFRKIWLRAYLKKENGKEQARQFNDMMRLALEILED